MKILHYLLGLPPVRSGGLVKYALDLAEGEMKLGNDVSILVPGRFTLFDKERNRIIKKRWNSIPCYCILNPLPVSGGRGFGNINLFTTFGDKKIYLKFLQELGTNVIHVHSFMGVHVAFLYAANELDIPIIYTTHDYYGLCPVAILLKGTEECTEEEWNHCRDCMFKMVSKHRLYLEQMDVYRCLKKNHLVRWLEHTPILMPIKTALRKMLDKYDSYRVKGVKEKDNFLTEDSYEELRQYYRKMFRCIDWFHFNSEQSREIYERYLGRLDGGVVPISNSNVEDKRMQYDYTGTLNIGYIGFGGYYKGYSMLKEVLDELYLEGFHDFVCHIYFNPKDGISSYLKIHAPYDVNRMEQVYRSMDVLILPSICRETFGMVVLEALSYGVPVIISDRVGAKDILRKHSGMGMIVAAHKEPLKTAIKHIYTDRNTLAVMNREICSWNTELSFERHVEEMLKMKEGVVRKNEC